MYRSLCALLPAACMLLLSLLARPAIAHIEMSKPPPRGSAFGPDKAHIDYNLKSPTHAICQGKPAGPVVGTYKAGSSIAVELAGSAKHNGGHCQFSLSYDGGKTFVVIKDVMNNCLNPAATYSVPIPATAPSAKHAIFAWSWINATGAREYYMNCADIAIDGVPDGKVVGPKMLVANIPGSPTIPEWGTHADNVGPGLFAARPNITVTTSGVATPPSGSYGASSAPTPQPSYSPVPDAPQAVPPPSAPSPSSTALPSSTATPQDSASPTSTPAPTAPASTPPTSAGGSCKEGEYRCIDSIQFSVCGAGGYLHTMKCGAGTVCVPEGSAIRCDHANAANGTKSAAYD